MEAHPLDTVANFNRADVLPYFLEYNVSLSRDLNQYFSLSLRANYLEYNGNSTAVNYFRTLNEETFQIVVSKLYDYQNYGLALFLELDLLAKREYENLKFSAGFDLSHFRRINTYNEIYTLGERKGETLSGYRQTRKGSVARFVMEMRWEDYIYPKLAYSLGLNLSPRYYFSPNSLAIENIREWNEDKPNEYYQQGDLIRGSVFRESIWHWSGRVFIGLIYSL